MIAADWPGTSGRLQAALIGIPIRESLYLDYDQMMIARDAGGREMILVGDEKYFVWRMEMIELNNQLRERVRKHIEATATRILGEPWEVSQ